MTKLLYSLAVAFIFLVVISPTTARSEEQKHDDKNPVVSVGQPSVRPVASSTTPTPDPTPSPTKSSPEKPNPSTDAAKQKICADIETAIQEASKSLENASLRLRQLNQLGNAGTYNLEQIGSRLFNVQGTLDRLTSKLRAVKSTMPRDCSNQSAIDSAMDDAESKLRLVESATQSTQNKIDQAAMNAQIESARAAAGGQNGGGSGGVGGSGGSGSGRTSAPVTPPIKFELSIPALQVPPQPEVPIIAIPTPSTSGASSATGQSAAAFADRITQDLKRNSLLQSATTSIDKKR